MYSFTNDYSEGAHPRILEAMMNENLNQQTAYGLDPHCLHAAELIKKEIRQKNADVHFLVGGTQTNLLVISAALRPYQAVISAHTGHVNVHETGAIEATGHKVLAMETPDGKLTPALVQKALDAHTDEHMVQPKLVYISNSTEVGTQYTKAELEALSHVCNLRGLYLFMDGARMGSALTSQTNDLTLADIASLVDAFYIGGTKNAALFGEALVICRPSIKSDFRFMLKQRGAMLAKGWLLGIQFEELFQNNLFYETAAHANEMADQLRAALTARGFQFASASTTNQLFPILPDALVEKLSQNFTFNIDHRHDETHTVIRLVTSWATPQKSVDEFVEALN